MNDPQHTSRSSEIHLIRLTKAYRTGRGSSLLALNKASLWIRRGETLSVVGPTGCGKSTLLRTIAGLDQPDSGTVTFDGESVDALTPAQRSIGLVFQNYALYPHFKVRGNIAFYFRLRRWSAPAIDRKVQETARIMGLGFDKLLGRMPRSLSGGERQRVALARCLSRNPRVLLLDEPFSNLDAALRLQTRSEVKKLVDRFELTTIFVTHDQSEAVAIGHRIAVMQAGQIEQVGTYHELYHHPANVFVAGFLGSPPMNFFPARRQHDTIRLQVEDAALSIPLPDWLRSRLAPDEPLTIGLRPEHLRLTAPHAPDGFAASADMVEVSMSDASQVVHLRHGQRTFLVKTALQPSIQPHERLWLQLPTEPMYFFDQHGKRF